MQPSEFWNLTLTEFWWEFDSRLKVQRKVSKGPGGFTQAEWAEARKRHREKQALNG